MKSKLQKWGNSLALRIPKMIAKDAKVGQGSVVDISYKEGCLIVKAVKKEKTLEELLSKITDENLQEEIDFGDPEGKEVW